jgi:TfoX/Sxy family transcriptional regulator of competence genes
VTYHLTLSADHDKRIGVGIFWWLLIFSLDRFIVSSIKKSSSFFLQLLQAFPRIILAIIIGLVIAMPLELKIFEKEINLQLVKMQNEELIENKKTQEAVVSVRFWEIREKIWRTQAVCRYQKYWEKLRSTSAIAKLPYKTCTGKNKDGSSYSYSCRPGITALKDKLSS